MRRTLTVVGLGYVGMPLAHAACEAGLRVVGLDTDDERVRRLAAGSSVVDGVSDAEVQAMLANGFLATTDPSHLRHADVVVICVPTPMRDRSEPDLSAVEHAAATIARYLHDGMLVILESTTYPGTTENVVRPLLERTGLKAGVDFALAFSPERIDPGNTDYGLKNTPKVVGGLTPRCRAAAADFYSLFVDRVIPAKGLREAEMAKLLENTYRQVNIALVNEVAVLCDRMGIDVWDVVAAAGTKPFGFEPFHPGPGVGGHCIPVDPGYLSYCAREAGEVATMAEAAQARNDAMPGFVARRIARVLADEGKPLAGAHVLLLGVTYKADVADLRGTPALPLAESLLSSGAIVSYHDPLVPRWSVRDRALHAVDLAAAVATADVVVVLTHHSAYDFTAIERDAKLVLDTRGRLVGPRTTRL